MMIRRFAASNSLVYNTLYIQEVQHFPNEFCDSLLSRLFERRRRVAVKACSFDSEAFCANVVRPSALASLQFAASKMSIYEMNSRLRMGVEDRFLLDCY